MSQNSITAFIGSADSSNDTGPNTEPLPHSITMNVVPLHTCEASIDGVDCQMPATQTYTIDTGDTRNLCDECFRKLLRMIRLHHYMRKIVRKVDDVRGPSWQQQGDERGQVA